MSRNIEDYFFGLSTKSSLIIWLLAAGYSPTEISQMRIKQLNKILKVLPTKLPRLRAWCEDTLSEHDEDERVFEKQKGVPMSKGWILDILIKAHAKIDQEFISVKKFIARVDVS